MVPGDYPDFTADRALRIHHWVERALVLRLRQLGVPAAGVLRHLARVLAPLPKVSQPVIVTTHGGIRLLVDPATDSSVERALFRRGVYEAGTLALLNTVLKPGDTFVDVGANIGLMSLTAAAIVGARGRVFAFEPHPDTHAILRYNLALNEAANVEAHEMGLGARRETRMLYEQMETKGYRSRGSASLVSGMAGGCEVLIDTLDGFLGERHVHGVRCLKVDVEGWELEVLRGAGRLLGGAKPPVLIVEHSTTRPSKEASPTALLEYLEHELTYDVFVQSRGKGTPSPLKRVRSPLQLPPFDNLVCLPRAGRRGSDPAP